MPKKTISADKKKSGAQLSEVLGVADKPNV